MAKRRRAAPDRVHPLVELGVGAAWLLGIAAALRLVDAFVGKSPLGAAFIGALVVDLGAGRAGVRWFREREARPGRAVAGEVPPRPARDIARSALLGASVSLAIAVLVVGVGLVAGHATVAGGTPTVGLLLMILKVVALAVRDEVLLRGLPLFTARRAGLPASVGVGFAALASPAALVLARGATVEALAVSLASGLTFALLWHRSGSAVPAVAAHAMWGLAAGSLLRGDALGLTWKEGLLSAGPRAAGFPAWIALAGFTVAAWWVWRSVRGVDAEPRSAQMK